MPAIALPLRATNCSPPSWQSARGDQCSLCPSRNVFQHLQALSETLGACGATLYGSRGCRVGVPRLAAFGVAVTGFGLLETRRLATDPHAVRKHRCASSGPVEWGPTDDDFDAGDI